jgi:5-methylcytosine-specific restriction endonuclease McrA
MDGSPPPEKKRRRSTGKRKRFAVLSRDGFRCAYCGRSPPEVELHVDHIVPVSAGGSDEESNLRAACADCNLGKGAIRGVEEHRSGRAGGDSDGPDHAGRHGGAGQE